MATRRTLGVFLCFVTMLTAPILSQESKKTEALKAYQEPQELVMRVLRGDKLNELKPFISLGAYIVDGATYESLFEALYGNNRSATLASESGRQSSFFHVTMTDDMSCAHLVVKTETSQHKEPRYHSVFLMMYFMS